MLMTKLKSKETISSLASGKVFIVNCHGCKEVGFPEQEAEALQKELAAEGRVVGSLTTDYICNPDELRLRLRSCMDKISEADAVLVFSCGVGYTLQILAQKGSNPTVVTILLSLESVFAVIAGAVVLHQQMTAREYLGCVLMFAAVILAQIPMPQKKKAKAE